jgi:hypothetical protein
MPAPATALSLLMLLAQPGGQGLPDLHRVACKLAVNGVCQDNLPKNVAGNGGAGGNAQVVYNIYFGANPQGGDGAAGGSVKSGVKAALPPAAAAAASSPAARISLALSRCRLTIAGKPEVDTKGCQFEKSEKQFTLTGPSTNQKYTYTIKVALNEDKTGQGFLSGGKSASERPLGRLNRKGACWLSEDDSVEVCAWK